MSKPKHASKFWEESPNTLSGDRDEVKSDSSQRRVIVLGLLSVLILFSLGTITIGGAAYLMIPHEEKVMEPEVNESVTSTSTSTSTSTTTSSTTTSTTTTSTTSTTTTTLCGGEFDKPCEDQSCMEGFTIGSLNLCQPIECSPSVPSGKEGCGAFALQYCK
ncbi:MAG: hypothetical protein ABH851_07880 [Methanobacteriota archaeon]